MYNNYMLIKLNFKRSLSLKRYFGPLSKDDPESGVLFLGYKVTVGEKNSREFKRKENTQDGVRKVNDLHR
jgi:hypothetical protein